MADREQTASQELERIKLKQEIFDEADNIFSAKWVEQLIRYVLFFIAIAIFTLIVSNYILDYIRLPIKQ